MVERFYERGRRAAMIECHTAGDIFQTWRILGQSVEQAADCRFAFADQHTIHSAVGVPQDFFGDKRNTVSTDTGECFRKQGTRSASEIDDFWNVGEVIDRERDDIRVPAFNQAEKILVRFALQIDQANRMTGAPSRSGYKFEAKRFEPKINLRVHQTAGMNGQEFHLFDTSIGPSASREKLYARSAERVRYSFAWSWLGACIFQCWL